MGIRYLKKYAALEGQVTVEDAETLSHWLDHQHSPAVQLGKCEHVHAAVLQVLLARRPRVLSSPADPWLEHALKAIALV
jgi:hypothetical protein